MGNSKILKEINYSTYKEFNQRYIETRLPEIVTENYIQWLEQNAQKIPIKQFFEMIPTVMEMFIGLQISNDAWAKEQPYISHYLWIWKSVNGWTYFEKNCGKILKCRKSQCYSLYPDPNKPTQYYKGFKTFGKRVMRDFGENYNVILLSEVEWAKETYYGKI